MARSYKQLGVSKPAATTETILYTVPANTQTVISQILASNVGSSNNTVTISVVAGGGAAAAEDKIIDTRTLVPDEVLSLSGVTIEASDEIRVESSDGNSVFHAYGEEIT